MIKKIIVFWLTLIYTSQAANATLLSEVRTIIQGNYITPPNNAELDEAAVKGMLHSLDPYSNYLNKESVARLNNNESYDGIGIKISIRKNNPIVLSVHDESPAQVAGIKAGDIIISVDGKQVIGLKKDDVRHAVLGKENSYVEIAVMRGNEQLFFKVKRGKVKVIISTVKLIDDIAYLRIKHFSRGIAAKIKADLLKLQPFKGMIIDLRYNPGGLLNEVIDISSLFLKSGLTIVSVKSKNDRDDFVTHYHDITNGVPIVVVINGLSASASEILAGALQDHKRAQVLGVTSFGKGSVQRAFPLSNGGAVKLTTALYCTPKGKKIQGVGVKPNIIVEDSMLIKKVQPLDFVSGRETTDTLEDTILYESTILGDPNHDFQLIRALDLIRTMQFYRENRK